MKTDTKNWYERLYQWSMNPAVIALAIFILLLIISFGTSSFGMNYDEGYYNYIGYVWLKHGVLPYLGALDNKNPPIFMLHGISSILFGPNYWFPRLLGILALTLTALIVFSIGKTLYSRTAGILAMLFFGLTIAWKSTGGKLTAQTESFMVLFVVLAFHILVQAFYDKKREWHPGFLRLFLAGMSMAAAIAFKQSGLFCAVGLLLFYISLKAENPFQTREIFRDLSVVLSGIVVSTAVSLVPIFMSELTLADYYRGAWLVLFEKGSPTATPLVVRLTRFIETFKQTELVLFYPLIFLFIFQRRILKERSVPIWGIFAWMIFDFLAVNASGTYATHLLRLLAPSLAIIAGIAIGSVFDSGLQHCRELIPESEKPKQFLLLTMVIVILWVPIHIEPLAAARKVIFKIDYSDRSQLLCEEPYSRPEPNDLKQLGLWIRENTRESDFVYIASYGAPAQAYSERVSPSRYFDSIFLKTPNAGRELKNDLLQKMPRLILIPKFNEYKVWVPGEIREFIDKLVQEHYKYKTCRYGYEVYEQQ